MKKTRMRPRRRRRRSSGSRRRRGSRTWSATLRGRRSRRRAVRGRGSRGTPAGARQALARLLEISAGRHSGGAAGLGAVELSESRDARRPVWVSGLGLAEFERDGGVEAYVGRDRSSRPGWIESASSRCSPSSRSMRAATRRTLRLMELRRAESWIAGRSVGVRSGSSLTPGQMARPLAGAEAGLVAAAGDAPAGYARLGRARDIGRRRPDGPQPSSRGELEALAGRLYAERAGAPAADREGRTPIGLEDAEEALNEAFCLFLTRFDPGRFPEPLSWLTTR